jgi:hypothetical protein
MRTHRLSFFAAAFVAAAVVACSTRDAEFVAADESALPATGPGTAPITPALSAERAVGFANAAGKDVTPSVAPQTASQRDTAAVGMVIRNGTVSIEVDSLETAVAVVRQLASRFGGYLGNVSMSTGEQSIRSATIEVKIPAARFDEAMGALSPIGKVEHSNATAEDVGEEYVDISARTANARRLEERLITLLATRTGKLEDVLTVERELARVREEIERHEGRLRYLRTRAAMSTLAITVHEAAPLVNPTHGTSVIGEAFRQMWRNFVQLTAAFIESLGILIPLAGLLLAAWWAWRRRVKPAA